MKQIVQNYRTGELRVEDVPTPMCRPGGVLVRTVYSLVSAGTERMKVDQARMSLLAKARARPDKVKQVIQSVRQVGLSETMQKVRERLDALTPLGYSLAGIVEEVGAGVDHVKIGDRVACAGEGIAAHAEFVSVPINLCAKIPDDCDMKDAAFATVGAIAMQGVRQAGVTLGDAVLVVGLGLVGLLAVQILKAAGCKVIGVDLDPHKVELAKACGADVALCRNHPTLEETIRTATGGIGPDAAYIAASANSADPMKLAGEVLRDRGHVIIVGIVPIEADWRTYYRKELSVFMSRSYGPGRYDINYELKGLDYPIGYVRWTQKRNIEEFLRLVSTGAIQPSRLGPRIFKLDDAPIAYQELHDAPQRHATGMLFEYDQKASPSRTILLPQTNGRVSQGNATVGIGLIGAGNFATGTLIPALKKIDGVDLRSICSITGLSAKSAGKRHGFAACASDYQELLRDASIHAVVIATRHDTHARFAAEALRAGKDVFVEKPLALNWAQLEEVIAAHQETGRMVIPGFNRRFSPMSVAVRDFFAERSGPIEIICRVNAGAIGTDSWYQDSDEGGWRIISEGCHFVDLVQFLCGSPPIRVFAEMIGGDIAGSQNDNCSVILRMQDGSVATIIYVANGDTSAGKERIEVFGQGRTAVIDNWNTAMLTAGGRTRKVRGAGKGHAEELASFIDSVRKGSACPISFEQAVACTAATFAIGESLVSQKPQSCELKMSDQDASSGHPDSERD